MILNNFIEEINTRSKMIFIFIEHFCKIVLAARHLGLRECTYLVKRAIQFGTRIAKHTNVLYHGSNRKGKGEALIKDYDRNI